MTAVYDGIRGGAAELALRRNGWSGQRLQKEARRIVNDYIKAKIPYLAPHRRDDLVDFVVEKALLAALRFDPEHPTSKYGTNGGRHFDSWLCDEMWNRCTDWLRSRAEGNGDSRYGNDKRVLLSPMEDEPDTDFDFGALLSEKRMTRWQAAARATDWTFEEFVVITLDRAAAQVERTAA